MQLALIDLFGVISSYLFINVLEKWQNLQNIVENIPFNGFDQISIFEDLVFLIIV